MKLTLLIISLCMLLFSTSCIGGQQEFDLTAFLKNPVVMILIGGAALWFAFKGSKH